MSAADDILAEVPLDQLAAHLGTDEATAEQAVRSALPALFGGLQANVADEPGGLSLAEALTQHSDPQFFQGGVSLDQIDTDDGERIVQHIFANDPGQAQVLRASGAGGGLGGGLIGRLLPILAPIVMAYLARRLSVGANQQSAQSSGGMGGGLGDMLGPILGGMFGGGAGGHTGSAGGGFGDILGQILGGQSQQAAPAPVETHDSGQWSQPQFNNPDDTSGQVRMPTADEDDGSTGQRGQQSQQQGGLGDILGGIFGR